MPIPDNPPAIYQQVEQPQTPLMSEMVKRAAHQQALADPNPPSASLDSPKDTGVSTISKLLYGAGLGADAASTIYGWSKGQQEGNPLINFAGNKWALPIGGAEELGTYLLAKKFLGNRHPKIMNMLVSGAGIGHGLAAAHNISLLPESHRTVQIP